MQSGICFQSLSNLVELDLSFNKISNLGGNLNAKLGNVRKLNLAGNELDSVEGNLRTSFLLICLFCLKAEQVPSLYALQPSPCVVWEKVRLLLIVFSELRYRHRHNRYSHLPVIVSRASQVVFLDSPQLKRQQLQQRRSDALFRPTALLGKPWFQEKWDDQRSTVSSTSLHSVWWSRRGGV